MKKRSEKDFEVFNSLMEAVKHLEENQGYYSTLQNVSIEISQILNTNYYAIKVLAS